MQNEVSFGRDKLPCEDPNKRSFSEAILKSFLKVASGGRRVPTTQRSVLVWIQEEVLTPLVGIISSLTSLGTGCIAIY